jgi:glycosyltransferase involved in cell wall biosynthesis
MTSPFFSIIIPVRQTTDYLRQTLAKLKEQSYKNFEVIVITDKDVPNHSDPIQLAPAYKRNLGASKSKGDYLAFLDDDSYPHPDWLQNCANQIKNQPKLAGLCGPCLTPPHDNIFQQASGLVWSSFIGSGGAGVYRNSIKPARYVDDYPSVNLIIKKSIFDQIGGFQTDFWPGEDTILCLEITHTLGQKILYHPDIIVYHSSSSANYPLRSSSWSFCPYLSQDKFSTWLPYP